MCGFPFFFSVYVFNNFKSLVFLQLTSPFFMRDIELCSTVPVSLQTTALIPFRILASGYRKVITKVSYYVARMSDLGFFFGQRQLKLILKKNLNVLFYFFGIYF